MTLSGMRMIRANAAAWGVDPNRIAVMGFSAGAPGIQPGHPFDAGDKNASDPVEKCPAGRIYDIVLPGHQLESTLDPYRLKITSCRGLVGPCSGGIVIQ